MELAERLAGVSEAVLENQAMGAYFNYKDKLEQVCRVKFSLFVL